MIDWGSQLAIKDEEIERLTADNARLRAVISGMMEATDLDDVQVIGRTALEPKP